MEKVVYNNPKAFDALVKFGKESKRVTAKYEIQKQKLLAVYCLAWSFPDLLSRRHDAVALDRDFRSTGPYAGR